MSRVDVVEVLELDPRFRNYQIEGTIPYAVKFRAEDGFLYFQQVWAKDEIDAYMQVATGNFSELNQTLMKEQTRDPDSDS